MVISIGTPDGMVEKAKQEHDADFNFADENADKILQEAELEEYLRNKGGLVWHAEGEEFFMYVDTNRDGKVSLEEMQDAKYANPMKLLEKFSLHEEM
jgi:Ca2+-binding EF-hand superfamily protein